MSKNPFGRIRAINDRDLSFVLNDHAFALRRLLRLYRWRWVGYAWAVVVTLLVIWLAVGIYTAERF